jgi:FlaG/FlaF family flagellin (archaellin)
VTPVVGVVLLLAVTALLAGGVGAAALSVTPPEEPVRAALSLSVDADADRIRLVHEGGDALAAGTLRVRVAVDGDPLAHQPPVPFFAATGFESGPTGPFNSATNDTWTAGEVAGFRLASTNDPSIRPGSTVRVRMYADGQKVAELRSTA